MSLPAPLPPPPTDTGTTTSPTTTSHSTTTTSSPLPPPPTTTTTTSSTTTSSSTTTTSSTSTTSTSSTSSTTSTPTSTSSTSSVITTPTSSTTLPPTTTHVTVITPTSTSIIPVTITSTGGPTETASSNTGSTPFFKNTGAVAGVFTVVGLAVLALIIALATNAVRRHRARKFDEDVAAAAAEASKVPTYPFDDDDPSHGTGYGSASGYSDPESHGTLAQTPMTHAGDYGMAEYPGFAPVSTFANAGVGGYGSAGVAGYGSSSAAYGPAGAGAGSAGYGGSNAAGYGAANVYSNAAGYGPSAAAGYGQGASAAYGAAAAAGIAGFAASQAPVRSSQNAVAPYGAFAGPGGPIPGSNDVYGDTSTAARHRSAGSRAEMVEAAMAAGAYLSRGASSGAQQTVGRKQSQGPRRTFSPDSDQNSSRSGSARVASSNGQESYAAHYAADFRPEAYQYAPPPPPLPNTNVNRTSYPNSDRDSLPILPNPANRLDVVPRTGATPAPPYSEAFDSALEGDNDDAYGEDSYMPVPHVNNEANLKNSDTSYEHQHILSDDDRDSIRDEEDYGRGGRTLKVANE